MKLYLVHGYLSDVNTVCYGIKELSVIEIIKSYVKSEFILSDLIYSDSLMEELKYIITHSRFTLKSALKYLELRKMGRDIDH